MVPREGGHEGGGEHSEVSRPEAVAPHVDGFEFLDLRLESLMLSADTTIITPVFHLPSQTPWFCCMPCVLIRVYVDAGGVVCGRRCGMSRP
jgi:hypothetical protein